MRETEALVERVWRLAPRVQRMEVVIEPALEQIEPGQRLLGMPPARNWQPYLRDALFRSNGNKVSSRWSTLASNAITPEM
ncbi:MAG: hypothetical protein HC915_00680 [Anaerolineae bacterium]|nr:hypothetical protein [Anaerolineae bacterium]